MAKCEICYKMAKRVFSWPAQLKMGNFFEIVHEMANLATLVAVQPQHGSSNDA